MSELRDLYQEVILDHNRNPRNFRKIENSDAEIEGYNPLCGDRLTLYLKMNGETIQDVSFLGTGCAISKASGSIMTSSVKGKKRREVEELFQRFQQVVTGKSDDRESLGKLVVLSGVAEFPTRVKCATLAWHTLCSALSGHHETVSTEEGHEDGDGKH